MPKITRQRVFENIKEARMGLNRELAGKIYPVTSYEVTADAIHRYAAATNEDNPAFSAEDAVGPPAFPIVAGASAIAEVMFDPDLGANIMMLVHGEEDHILHDPIRVGDRLSVQSSLESVELKDSGETFTISTKLTNQHGRLAAEIRSLMFIRGTGQRPGRSADEQAPVREIVSETVQKIDEDQTYRYADASGDHNLIHVDPEFAKNMAGLPGIIVHGMCTMAFAGKAVVDGVCGGDPGRLHRIKVRFSKPVFPGETLATTVWFEDRNESLTTYGFETLNPQRLPVIRAGVAEVRRS